MLAYYTCVQIYSFLSLSLPKRVEFAYFFCFVYSNLTSWKSEKNKVNVVFTVKTEDRMAASSDYVSHSHCESIFIGFCET